MRYSIKLLFVLTGALGCAYAQTGNWFVGANTGFAELSSPGNASQGLQAPSPQRPTSYSVYFGHTDPLGSRPDLQLGWTIQYNNYGKTSYSAGGSSLNYLDDSTNFLLVFSQTFANQVNYFIEPGIAYVRQKADLSAPATINGYSFGTSANEVKKFEPTIALGLGYQFTPHLNGYIAYNHTWGLNESDFNYVNASGYNNKPFATHAYRVGVSYIF